MQFLTSLLLGAALSVQTLGVSAEFNAGCVTNCISVSRGNFVPLGCKDAADAACLCAKPDFFFSARDCSVKSCAATENDVHASIAGFCPTLGKLATSSPVAQPSTSQPAPQTSQSSVSPSQTPTPTPSAASATSTPSPSATSQSASGMTTSTLVPSTTSTQTASATQSADNSTSTPVAGDANSGISHATSVGIGVGVAAAVVGIAIVAFCVLKNRKRKAPRQSMDISKPLPGSGRTYGNRDGDAERDSFEKYANESELQSNRYEDMAVGQQPRTMV